MKIKGMFPAITCKNSDELIKFSCENFGFHVEHRPHAVMSENESDRCNILKTEDGIRFDVIQYDVDAPMCGMCINVDDFEEALSVFIKDGYEKVTEPVIVDNSKKALLAKVDNIPILLIQHYIKEAENN